VADYIGMFAVTAGIGMDKVSRGWPLGGRCGPAPARIKSAAGEKA
jgi:hypothetical protein